MGGSVGVGVGGQSGCERRIEVFVKIQKKKIGGWGGRGEGGRVGGVGSAWGGQSGCERRIEGFCENSKKRFFLGGWGGPCGGRWGSVGASGSGWVVRVDVNEELKFLLKFKKKNWGGSWGVVEGSGEGSGWM